MGARSRRAACLLVSMLWLGACGGATDDDRLLAGPMPSLREEEATEVPPSCGIVAKRTKDIRPGRGSSDPRGFLHGSAGLVFSSDDGRHGREPWSSTGRDTRLLRDIRGGQSGSDPTSFTRLGDTVFFVADDGVHGRELWKTDGSSAGTQSVVDLRPGVLGSDPDALTVFQGRLYFTADSAGAGRELWRTDGSSEGTARVTGLIPDGGECYGLQLAATGSFLYVQYGYSGHNGDTLRLARLDGTPGGLVVVMEVVGDNSIEAMTPVGELLYFLHNNDESEWSLFVTNGSPAGTRGLRMFPDKPHDLIAFAGKLYFASGVGPYEAGYAGDELWRSDGTSRGTVLVKDILPGKEDASPRGLATLDGKLYFSADDGAHGRELWRTDGTPNGTVLVQDIQPGPVGSAPDSLSGHAGRLFFSADTTGRGREAWMFEASTAQATALDDVAPGPASSSPSGFVRSGWALYFSADDGVSGRELWALSFRSPGPCPIGPAR
ncbi:hypothetical protein JGU66_21630 [Myxococcaceae bacterium JPH2]|nr:hypothetical protein [Myxococcaceae bacterium JPH2]